MLYYPNADVYFYVDKVSPWERCLCYKGDHSWALNNRTSSGVIRYWRDIDGVKKEVIKKKDLYIPNIPKSRIRKEACLPMLYATGYRYIKLTKAGPAGFKCAPSPVDLATARVAKTLLAKARKAARKAAKKAKREAKKAKAAEKKRLKLAKQKRGAK